MQLTAADHALAEGFAGAQPFEPANDEAILFHLTIRQYDGTLISESGLFMDSIAARDFGEDLGGLGSRVTVRPDIETSYLHGRARYPNPLHKLASLEATEGWAAAAAIAYARDKLTANDRRALMLDQQRADVDRWISGEGRK